MDQAEQPRSLRNFHEKTEPELAAQAEAYGETLNNLDEYHEVMQHLDVVNGLRSLNDLEGVSTTVRAAVERHRDRYLSYLRTSLPTARLDREQMRFYREQYQIYRDEVRTLKQKIQSIADEVRREHANYSKATHDETDDPDVIFGDRLRQLPEVVGASFHTVVLRLENSSTPALVKVPRQSLVRESDFNRLLEQHNLYQQMRAMRLMHDVPHVTHMLGYSPADQAIVVQHAAGRPLSDGPANDVDELTHTHLEQLVDVAVIANDRGVKLDPFADNYWLDPNGNGISVIDYDLYEHIDWAKSMIGIGGFISLGHDPWERFPSTRELAEDPSLLQSVKQYQLEELLSQDLTKVILAYRQGGFDWRGNPDITRRSLLATQAPRFKRPLELGDQIRRRMEIKAELLDILAKRHPTWFQPIEQKRLSDEAWRLEQEEKDRERRQKQEEQDWIVNEMESDSELLSAYDRVTAQQDRGEITEDQASELYAAAYDIAYARWLITYAELRQAGQPDSTWI